MLRITVQNDVTTTRLQVEGKLKGPWVVELQNCWQSVRSAQPHKPVQVDLTKVTFIDTEGGELLARMHESGTLLTASGLTTQMVNDAIKRCGR
jgi:anti-anti-sigma regulatory factor